MRYYKTNCGKLIQFNIETKVYKLRNTIQTTDKRISVEDFKNFNSIEIKKDEFSRLMNIYFKNVKHEWIHDGVKYRKIDNFEGKGILLSDNYKIGKDVPYHHISKYEKNYIIVYHWGKVYYHTISYNGYAQGQLIDIKTNKTVRWARLKNCAPIFDTVKKQIV